MEGERGVYVHRAVEEQQAKVSVSAEPAYAELVCKELKTAADIMSKNFKVLNLFRSHPSLNRGLQSILSGPRGRRHSV